MNKQIQRLFEIRTYFATSSTSAFILMMLGHHSSSSKLVPLTKFLRTNGESKFAQFQHCANYYHFCLLLQNLKFNFLIFQITV